MSNAKLLPQPRTWSSSTHSLKLRRRLTSKALDALHQPFSAFPRRVERGYRDLELKVRFFEAGDYDPQAYKIEIGEGGVIVYAGDAHGLYYGHQTLRQLLSQCTGSVPCCVIEDAPAFPRRGFHLDLSIHKLKPTYIRELFAGVARLKITDVFVQYHDTFPFRRHPAIQGSVAYSEEQIKDLEKAAAEHGLQLVPVQPVFDQLGYALCLQFHSRHALPDAPDCLNYAEPAARKLVESLLDDICALHDGDTVYLGALPLGCAAADSPDEIPPRKGFDDYLLHLVRHLAKRGKCALLDETLVLRAPDAVAALPEASVIAVDASRPAAAQRAERYASAGARVFATIPGRHPRDDEFTQRVDETVELARACAHTAGTLEAEGVIISSRSAVRERLRESVFGTPVAEMTGGRRMHVESTMLVVAAAAAAAWNPDGFDLQHLQATWPWFWFGVDDKRFSELYLLQQRNAADGATNAEILRGCRRIAKLCEELTPKSHAASLLLASLYARLGIHAVHVGQAFSRSTRKQQVSLLASEVTRLKELMRNSMHDSLYRTGVSEEQHYFFQHTDLLLKRLQRG